MYVAQTWQDYELLDAGGGEKLERWGDALLLRPDPLAVWPADGDLAQEPRLTGHYHRAASGGGQWEFRRPLPQDWQVGYRYLRFRIGAMGFKHTGLFPEQAVNWDWMGARLRAYGRPAEVLNLFAYTGGATVACAAAGASVVHVDASKGMTQWAKDNLALSGLASRPVRFLVDDCMKFVLREGRRGRRYQGIVMDPPSYGRGPDGQTWKIEEHLVPLVQACLAILDPDPAFFLINSYTTGLSAGVLRNVLLETVAARCGGRVEAEEIGLPLSRRPQLALPCGASGRWQP